MITTVDSVPKAAAALLHSWLRSRLDESAVQWLAERLERSDSERDFYLAISLAPRKVGKGDLQLSTSELAAAETCRPGWNPADWTVDQAARLYLLIEGSPGEMFHTRLEKLFSTADVGEQVALYQGLPIFPDPDRLRARGAEGIRSNIKAVVEAVAHENPFPADHFDEPAWNQMILKAVFIGIPLDPIRGIDRRANLDLAGMLCDFAKERWAAGRDVSPDLWRCVVPFHGVEGIRNVLEQAKEKGVQVADIANTPSHSHNPPNS